MSHPTGSRLRCAACGSETIIVKSGGSDLSCCGQELEVIFTPPNSSQG